MIASRTLARSARVVRVPLARGNIRHARFQSSTSSVTQTSAQAGGASGLVGGLAGGALVFAAGYGYYHFSGAKTLVNAASSTKKTFESITQSVKNTAPEPNEALKWFRQTVSSYATFIPGAKQYVDATFNSLDKVEQKHRGEVNEIVTKAYNDLREASKSGLTAETAQKTWTIVEDALKKLGDLAADSAGDIADEFPEVKEKLGGNLDQLKEMAGSYGPEAKKEIDETYKQIKDILAGGIGAGSIYKVKGLIEEKIEQVKKMSEEAWSKGLEQAKPILDKNPQIKELLEKNKDTLRSGNLTELWEKVKSNNADDLQKYISQASEKAQSSGIGKEAEKYFKMIPGASEIVPKLQKLASLVKDRGDEAEKLLKETVNEISDVLKKKTGEAEKIANKAKKDAKS